MPWQQAEQRFWKKSNARSPSVFCHPSPLFLYIFIIQVSEFKSIVTQRNTEISAENRKDYKNNSVVLCDKLCVSLRY